MRAIGPVDVGVHLVKLEGTVWGKSLLLIFISIAAVVAKSRSLLQWFCLDGNLFGFFEFWVQEVQRLMVFFPNIFEILEFFGISFISEGGFVVFLHPGDAFEFCHHFLEVASALSGGPFVKIFSLGFKDFTESRWIEGYFLLRLEAKMFS